MTFKPVLWRPGMLLSSQQFQLQNRVLEDSLHFRFVHSVPYNYGLSLLTIDHELLRQGILAIRECEGIMPDGTSFSMPGSDDVPAHKDLNEGFGADLPINIYLELPRRHAERNVIFPEEYDSLGDKRYIAESIDVADEYARNSIKTVQVGRRNFRLLEAHELEFKNVGSLLPLVRINKQSTGEVLLNHNFTPPLLALKASPFLHKLLTREIALLNEISYTLQSYGIQNLSDDLRITTGLVILRAHLAELTHIARSPLRHPEDLFVVLSRLAGALEGLMGGRCHLPPYDHNNVGQCLEELDRIIFARLEDLTLTPRAVSIPLTQHQHRLWNTNISDPSLFERRLYLSVSADIPSGDLTDLVVNEFKVASRQLFTRGEHAGSPGWLPWAFDCLRLHYAPNPPACIQLGPRSECFRVSQGGSTWADVVKTRTLCVYVPGTVPDVDIRLLALP